MKRTPLKKVSDKQKERLKKYNAMFHDDDFNQSCAACKRSGSKFDFERHHPKGRGGEHLYEYVYVCVPCHRWVHENHNEAAKKGLILPEYRGRKS